MKFMVEFQLKPGVKQQAVEAFELKGPSRNAGVSFHGAWVGKTSDLVFVLVESENESFIVNAAQSWSELGSYKLHPVIDVEDF
jgi:hypothetical protein